MRVSILLPAPSSSHLPVGAVGRARPDPYILLCAERTAWCLGRHRAGAMGGRKARGSGLLRQPRCLLIAYSGLQCAYCVFGDGGGCAAAACLALLCCLRLQTTQRMTPTGNTHGPRITANWMLRSTSVHKLNASISVDSLNVLSGLQTSGVEVGVVVGVVVGVGVGRCGSRLTASV